MKHTTKEAIAGLMMGAVFGGMIILGTLEPVPVEVAPAQTGYQSEAAVHSRSSQPTIEERTSSGSGVICKITAYCSCDSCCGEWAYNRPDGAVYGASGVELVPGYSVAADTDIYPFGTILHINGKDYRVDDIGTAVKGNVIDIYMSSHQEAVDYAVAYETVDVIFTTKKITISK